MTNPTLVEVMRSDHVESSHRGAAVIVDANAKLYSSWGDVDRPIFPRSAIKLLQALPLIASGAADALELVDAELALACASHDGESEHLRVAASMLAKAGLNSTALECGAPRQRNTQAAEFKGNQSLNSLHNNCSGKHAGFLCIGCHLARMDANTSVHDFVKGYVKPDHPVMLKVTAALEATTSWGLDHAPRGIDGCSIPTYAIPLRHLALAFARIGSSVGLSPEYALAARRLRRAVAREPFMVGGTHSFDTIVMQHFGERVVCKVGAEGVYCAALPELGLGIAIKIDDGNCRAAEVLLAYLLRALLATNDSDNVFLNSLSNPIFHNHNGLEVGAMRATLRDFP
jgi:L-asparaginase II